MTTEDDSVPFSWKDTESVVIERVEATAVYTNPKGDIVIRQEDTMGGDDAVIIVPRSRVTELILALQNVLED
ncbi:MAG TPA: hypothetical protein VJ654_07640 [Noviherbaspirillum sp.]|nr:hypothetical protein [Noviherbaspirillum sp.]